MLRRAVIRAQEEGLANQRALRTAQEQLVQAQATHERDLAAQAAQIGEANDPRTSAALQFALKLVRGRGQIDDEDVQELRRLGFGGADRPTAARDTRFSARLPRSDGVLLDLP
ncbi:hypothetical protein [Deinococcus sp. Leaf326]|uniref:hypothetical protein n=1 Tax=Deinococcus sp. Leaf326 TaxID=1736338 RepID=UPI0006FC0557|nr:hypothetical protein [Deinococcus sp. Leaf326]KQR07209.1 hypothetical protein ASF71_21055 [Deinococcus sp. Leaf326]